MFIYFFSMYYWLFSTNIRFFYKILISKVDCHGEKTTKHVDQCGSFSLSFSFALSESFFHSMIWLVLYTVYQSFEGSV